MTDDVQTVCERHEIALTGPDDDGGDEYWLARGVYGDRVDLETGDTAIEAVCALLKARYGITASDGLPHWIGARRWFVTADVEAERHALHGPSEFAAVVALADRLKGGAP